MKTTFPFFIALIVIAICVSAANAGDVKVEAYMTTSPKDEATTWFTVDSAKLYAMFKTKGAKSGDKIRGVLFADDVGDAATTNTKVFEKTIALDGDTEDGDFNFSKPTNDWPVGKYHIEIYVNDELATTAKFTIKAAKKKSSDEEEEESSDDE